jgi:hypothetical protein
MGGICCSQFENDNFSDNIEIHGNIIVEDQYIENEIFTNNLENNNDEYINNININYDLMIIHSEEFIDNISKNIIINNSKIFLFLIIIILFIYYKNFNNIMFNIFLN